MAALVAAARGGDERAWNLLHARFDELVWSVTRSHGLSRFDAWDVVQTTWLRLCQHIHRLEEPERVGSWLSTTARRECLRLLRERQRQAPSAFGELILAEVVPAVDELLPAERSERDRAFWEAVSRIPPLCQMLVRLLVADPGPSYQEIADGLGMPLGSIGPTRGRCLDRLRAELLAGQRSARKNGAESVDGSRSTKRPTGSKEVS